MKKVFINALNKAFNTYINIDPSSHQRLQALEGKAVTIHLLPLNYTIQLLIREQGVIIQEEELLVSQVKIIGTPLQLMGLMLNKDARQQFFSEDVKIEGDAEVGQQVISLFDELNIDWEDLLSKMIGDVPAYHLGKVANRIKDWAIKLDASFSADLSDFLHEELAILPTKDSLNDYYDEIDLLRMDVDRVEAKLVALKKMLHEGHT